MSTERQDRRDTDPATGIGRLREDVRALRSEIGEIGRSGARAAPRRPARVVRSIVAAALLATFGSLIVRDLPASPVWNDLAPLAPPGGRLIGSIFTLY